MRETTVSLVSHQGSANDAEPAWYLSIAFDASCPFADVRRVSLDGIDSVVVGRGAERKVAPDRARLRVELADRYLSQDHFTLERNGASYRLADAGSKNGTRVRGARAARALLEDGDVIEAGATFMVVRRGRRAAGELDVRVRDARPMPTLSPALQAELDVVANIAPTTLPILVRGESGTGKELAARAIHAASGRRGALVAVNCGALAPGIIEAELFGARRGAFTGAVEERPGLVRAASGGTLFLDEIAELPLAAQAALLRVLQENEVRPLGAHQAIDVNVRVIAATHRDVDALVAAGGFRHDLAARLRGHVLTLPPLRERREDLGIICADLLRRIRGGERPQRTMSRHAARALFAYPWPANVRELEHVLRAAVARAGDEITLESLPDAVRNAAPAAPADAPAKLDDDARRAQLVELLERHGGNLSAVARSLATSRSQLRRLLRRYGVALAARESDDD